MSVERHFIALRYNRTSTAALPFYADISSSVPFTTSTAPAVINVTTTLMQTSTSYSSSSRSSAQQGYGNNVAAATSRPSIAASTGAASGVRLGAGVVGAVLVGRIAAALLVL